MIIVNSDSTLSKFIGDIREMYFSHRYLRVTVKTGKARSGLQNSHSHVWYQQIAQELREYTPLGVKSYCKLNFGVPILYTEDDDFHEAWRTKIKPLFPTYEQKLALMEWFPVTSLMSKDQLHRYELAVQGHYLTRGVILEWIEKPVKNSRNQA